MTRVDDRAELARWAFSAAIVVFAHGSLAAGMMTWVDATAPSEPRGLYLPEMTMELVAPKEEQAEIPPGPEQVMAEAVPEMQKPVEEPVAEIPPAPNPDVALPREEPKQETELEPRAPAPATTAPEAAPVVADVAPAAPMQGVINPPNPKAVPTWQSKVLALLERHKRYPPAAQSRREQGVAQVLFTLDRAGHVLDSRILRSAGASALDAEALALLQRAQPFPPPPPELAGERVPVTLPVRFNLK